MPGDTRPPAQIGAGGRAPRGSGEREFLLTRFESIPTETRTALLVTGLIVFRALEDAVPLRRFGYRRGRHALLNLFFWATTLAVHLSFAVAIVRVSQAASREGFGLVQWSDMSSWPRPGRPGLSDAAGLSIGGVTPCMTAMKRQMRLALNILPLRPRWIRLSELLADRTDWCDELAWHR